MSYSHIASYFIRTQLIFSTHSMLQTLFHMFCFAPAVASITGDTIIFIHVLDSL